MQRKSYSAETKVRVALEALKGELTTNQIAAMHQVQPTLVSQWKKLAREILREGFSKRRPRSKGRHSWRSSTARLVA